MHDSRLTTSLLLVLVLSLGLTGVCYGQAGDTSKGSLSVNVLDASRGLVQGATIKLSGPAGESTATTNERGEAVFYNLAPGPYTVRAEAKGFRTTEIPGQTVSANRRSTVEVDLTVGAVTETVLVVGTAITVDMTTTTTGTNLSQATYSNLPVTRNVSGLFSLAAGAAPSGDSVLAGNPSISGSTGLENMYIIDGITTTDAGYGAFGVFSINYGSLGTGVNTDFVKEVEIKTGGFEAQYGQAMGGIVNIVTDSGGNKVHGSAYVYSAPGFAEGTYKQPNDFPRIGSPGTETIGRHSWDAGFNIGGPFIQNKFFWYGSFNPSFSTLERQGPVNYGTRALGPQTRKSKSYNWVGKLNYSITDAHRLEATAFGDPSRWPMQVNRTLVRDDLDSATSAAFGTRNWALKYNGLLGKVTLLNASFSWNHSYFSETPDKNLFAITDYGKPKPTGSSTAVGGPGNIGNDQGDSKQYSWMLTHNANILGSHQIDLGYAYNPVNYDAERYYTGPVWNLPASPGVAAGDVGQPVHGGQFYFYPTRTVAGVAYTNVYRQIRGNFGSPLFATTTTYQNAFVQDGWRINRYLTAKLGVRWEQQHIVGQVNDHVFAANWAPRVGIILDPTGSRKTKIFANWGRFFEKIPQDIATRAMSKESSYYLEYTSAVPPTAANLIPGSSYSPYAVDATVWAAGTKSMFQTEIVAGVERELPGGMVASARFIHRNVNRIVEDVSGITAEQANAGASQQFVLGNPSASLDYFHNAVACTSGANCDTDTGYTFDSGLIGPDGVPDGFPDARRVYKALELTLEKRMSKNWSLTTNYRLAKLFGNYEGLFRNDNGQSDPNITSLFDFAASPAMGDQFKVGVLPTDRRHIVNLYGNYLINGNLNIGMGWTALSGSPVSKLLSHPVYGNAGEIPVGGRGAEGRTPFQNYLDARAEYRLPLKSDRFKVKAGADIFNVFNRKTTTDIDQNAELSGAVVNKDFLKPLLDHRPIYARFSLRFEF
jgi:hypothetical protein